MIYLFNSLLQKCDTLESHLQNARQVSEVLLGAVIKEVVGKGKAQSV